MALGLLTARGDLTVVGPDVLIPGSDFLLGGVGRIFVVVGAIGIVVSLLIRLRRRRRVAALSTDADSRASGSVAAGPVAAGTVTGGMVAAGALAGSPEASQRHRPPIVTSCFAVVAATGLVLALIYRPPPFQAPELPALPKLLPERALFYQSVEDLGVDPNSGRWIAALDNMPLTPSFGSRPYQGMNPGVPFNIVDKNTPMVDVDLTTKNPSTYRGPFPITDPPYIEGMPLYGFDQHYLAIDIERRQAWELISLTRWFGRWVASAGATWSMDSLDYPTGSTIASRLPLLPGVITYAQVASGSIDHVILGSSRITARGRSIWPAHAGDGTSDAPDAPPMGAWLRLKADADLSGLGPQALVVAKAAQKYGIILSDTGPGFRVRGTADRRWDTDDIRTLATLHTDDFEVVDASAIKVSDDSLEARPTQADGTP